MDELARAERSFNDRLLLSIVDAAPDGMLVVDDQGLIEFANPMAARMFEYGVDELIGQPVEMLMPESVRAGHVAHRTGYTEHPRTRPMGSGLDLRGVRRSGRDFPIEIALSPVRLDGRTFVIATLRDVTERRAQTEELNRVHRELALVDDRERIARDLHDTVIQRLFAVGLSLQGAVSGRFDATDRIEAAIDEIDATIRDIRSAIFSLHTRRVPTSGVRDDIVAIVREAARALGFEPRLTFNGPVDSATPERVREQLVPTTREALTNVVKHARASKVSVTVSIADEHLTLEVLDDGVGIGDRIEGGRGLGNVAERAQVLGGLCETGRLETGGARFVWRVPLTAA